MIKKIYNKYGKKAFAFSFLAIFLSFLIFAYGSTFLFKGDFTKNDAFKNSRITYVDNEIKYFQNIYIKNSLEFSFYNTINAILENKSNLILINNNYSKLNSLIYEGMINGSLNGKNQISLENKTINYFVNYFSNNFYKNYLGNFSFNITKLNVYQKNSYGLSLQLETIFNITTLDNISTWNFKKTIFVDVPIYNLKDPEFFLEDDFNITIRPVDLYASNINWSVKLLNETLINNYSVVYEDIDYKYSLGNNFLAKILNISKSSYDKVLGFYSFDYDEEKGRVYDTTQISPFIKYYGNSRLLLNFDNSTINENNISDLTSYNNSGILYGNINCSIEGVYEQGCQFDGINDYINISNPNGLNFSDNFSISIWIKTNNSISNPTRIIRDYNYDLFLASGKIGFILNENVSSQIFYSNFTINTWNFITTTYSNNVSKLYLNGFLVNSTNYNLISNTNNNNFIIGSNLGQNEFFNGSIDELAIYSKVLSNSEITNIYSSQKIKFIDYKNSLQGKALEFDGIDDYINISNKTLPVNYFYNNWSIEIWFKPYNLSGIHYLVAKHHPFLIRTNNSRIELGIYDSILGWNFINSENLKINQNYYVVSSFDNSTKILSLYLNGKLMNQSNVLNGINSILNNDFFIGVNKYDGINFQNYFKGLIDEVKIYNRTLNSEEIEQNYYNYNGFAKGCCNYLNLINPNSMNYNNNLYDKNISYTSKVFYDYYKRGGNLNPNKYNLTLLNITYITSNITSKNYYNFLADSCMLSAYSIYNYNGGVNGYDFYKKNGAYNLTCSNLIKAGIY